MKNNLLLDIKLAVTTVSAALTAWLGALAVPVYILLLLNVIDYVTGITAAPYRGEQRSSYKGFRGIAKKVCMLLLVAVGGLADWLLLYFVQTVGAQLPFKFFLGAVVAIWLICNEMISILENIGAIGVKPPPFLRPFIEWVQRTTEDKVAVDKKQEGTDG